MKLLNLLLRHQKQGYKTSECTMSYWAKSDLDTALEHLNKNKIPYRVIDGIMNITWKK